MLPEDIPHSLPHTLVAAHLRVLRVLWVGIPFSDHSDPSTNMKNLWDTEHADSLASFLSMMGVVRGLVTGSEVRLGEVEARGLDLGSEKRSSLRHLRNQKAHLLHLMSEEKRFHHTRFFSRFL